MNKQYSYHDHINLFVEGRITKEDAVRQQQTAKEILHRLKNQPGLILADEVGMGKTFVALAVATSVALTDVEKRPVIVMVPPSLKEKWPRDFQLFKERCLPKHLADQIQGGSAERAVAFLKFLDDPPERKKSIIFLTHGAMYRGLHDHWVKLAIIRKALLQYGSPDSVRRGVNRFAGELLHKRWITRESEQVWSDLLDKPPEDWLAVLHDHGIDPEGDDNPENDDDPVPDLVIQALNRIDVSSVSSAIQRIPVRKTKYFKENLRKARNEINQELRRLWAECIGSLHYKLPLLVLDEAHHLKNPHTRFSSLFHVEEASSDADTISQGPLKGIFERMLFLTATPFQLGHHELCSVLERFTAISWDPPTVPAGGCETYQDKIKQLLKQLDAAQEAAVRFENTWGRLRKEDLGIKEKRTEDVDTWWHEINKKGLSEKAASPAIEGAIRRYDQTKSAMKKAEDLLSSWVIRHNKLDSFVFGRSKVPRRRRMIGNQIQESQLAQPSGIEVDSESLLPFLLAARVTTFNPDSRPVFAEGLASSYEAFLHTRRRGKRTETVVTILDEDDDMITPPKQDSVGEWYLNQLEKLLPIDSQEESLKHPKISVTVQRAVDLWRQGEKVLIFCHYIMTGRTLRQHISQVITQEIQQSGSEKLSVKQEDTLKNLDQIGQRFFDEKTILRRAIDEHISGILDKYTGLSEHREKLTDIIRRYVRTPTFLVRYFPLDRGRLDQKALVRAFNTKDGSGLTLNRVIEDFLDFLVMRCGTLERQNYIEALDNIQTGSIMGRDVVQTFGDDEFQNVDAHRRERLLPNVRLVNGSTKSETRQRLMLTFNTPFFPEILISSSVLAEGVDLHLNCRHVIHHDLCWNPSTLEQRTGRVDRIGAKMERCGQPLYIYLPYIAETQDEKMFRVVMDRERWFKVVMGESYQMDARSTEKLAERIPLPKTAAEDLAFSLKLQ